MTTVSATRAITPSEQFTMDHAHLGARDYIFAHLEWSEKEGAARMAAGEEGEIFKVRFEDRIFNLYGKKLDVDLEAMRVPDAEMVEVARPMETSSMASDGVMAHMLSLQEVGPVVAEPKTYDFRNMTRQEIADAGKELFAAGKITLDELFRFDHPDGKLKIDLAGNVVALGPNDRIDFVAEVEKALRNMEVTGEANQPKSVYPMMQGLLEKLLLLA